MSKPTTNRFAGLRLEAAARTDGAEKLRQAKLGQRLAGLEQNRMLRTEPMWRPATIPTGSS